jgi:DNA-binding CsgD family transcriptional regulator
MFLKRVEGLAQYLSEGDKKAEDIAKYLVLKTFSDLSPIALYMAELTGDGYLSPVGGFGFEKLEIANWGRFPLTMHIPITDCARRDECIIIRSVEEFYRDYPILNEIEGINHNWVAVVAFPMLPFGVGFIILNQQPDDSEDFKFFCRAVGAILSLHLTAIPIFRTNRVADKKPEKNRESNFLSARQKVIYEFMCKGLTNAQIAAEIGYSESLVRQETIGIYRVLGVTGRKEIILESANK